MDAGEDAAKQRRSLERYKLLDPISALTDYRSSSVDRSTSDRKYKASYTGTVMRCFLSDEVFLFNFYGSVQRKYIPIYIQQDANLHSLFISGNCCTCFGWYLHPSSGAHTTVSTASGICHTVTATCRYRGKVGTAL